MCTDGVHFVKVAFTLSKSPALCQGDPHFVKVICTLVLSLHCKVSQNLRGPWMGGRSEVYFHFFIVSYSSGEWHLPGTFFGMKKYPHSQSNRILKSRKYIKLHCALNFNRRFPTIFLKLDILLQFLR